MSVITAIYDHLSTDDRLNTLLGQSSIDPTRKAIYEEWADHETGFPYMNLTYSFGMGEHWAKDETLLNIDIFTESDSMKAEDIKEACIFSLDRQTIMDESDGAFIRCYYNRDGIITEPADGITHWNIEFTLMHWRQGFIRHLDEQ
jgi:hypothetical protein